MTTSSMNDIPTISIQHNDSSNIIHQATMQFIESGCQDINALETRAKALAGCAQSGLALRDAYEIVRLAPSSSIGHTLAAWIHTQYGQHKKAIQHYNQALIIEHGVIKRQEIKESQSDNEHQLSKRIDFVNELPFELVSSLILPITLAITSHGSLSYLHVCKTWRQKVLQTTQLQFTSLLPRGAMHLLVAYAPYMQKISLSHSMSFPFRLVDGTSFPSLEWLGLRLINRRHISHLYTLLQSTGGALKDVYLKLDHGIRHDSIQLDVILRHCPNLEVFNGNQVFLPPLESTYTRVKKLLIESMVHRLTRDTIIALVEHLPALKHLRLPCCGDSRALRLIHLHCPSLRTLAYSTTQEARVVYHEMLIIKEQGLHSLTVDGESGGLQLQDIASTLTTYSSTLINVDLTVDMALDETNSLALDLNVRFERLRNITLCIHDGDHDKEFVRWILARSPNARTVYAPPFNVDEADIYETMKGMHHLMSIGSLAPSTTMISLMEYHGILGKSSSLRKVKIGFNYNGEQRERILNAIAQLHQLEYLSLHLHGAGLGDGFVAYMDLLADECPCLVELELHACHKLPHEVISIFPMYTNLKYLSLYGPNTWDECLLDLLECPSLVSLHIPQDSIDMEVAEALEDLLLW